jgi:hypothetical protein
MHLDNAFQDGNKRCVRNAVSDEFVTDGNATKVVSARNASKDVSV